MKRTRILLICSLLCATAIRAETDAVPDRPSYNQLLLGGGSSIKGDKELRSVDLLGCSTQFNTADKFPFNLEIR